MIHVTCSYTSHGQHHEATHRLPTTKTIEIIDPFASVMWLCRPPQEHQATINTNVELNRDQTQLLSDALDTPDAVCISLPETAGGLHLVGWVESVVTTNQVGVLGSSQSAITMRDARLLMKCVVEALEEAGA